MQHFSVDDLYDATVIDADGDKVAGVSQVYLDDQDGTPNWVTVRTGFFGANESFIPLDGASFTAGELRVPYGKQAIKDAPNFDAEYHLSPEDEQQLYRHYNLSTERGDDRVRDAAPVAGTDLRDRDHDGRLGDDRGDQRDVRAAGLGAGAGAVGAAGYPGHSVAQDRRDVDVRARDPRDRDGDGHVMDDQVRGVVDHDRDGRLGDGRRDQRDVQGAGFDDRRDQRDVQGQTVVQDGVPTDDADLERRRRELEERERELQLDRREVELDARERQLGNRLRRHERGR